jgi:hypothetical protein
MIVSSTGSADHALTIRSTRDELECYLHELSLNGLNKLASQSLITVDDEMNVKITGISTNCARTTIIEIFLWFD